MTATLGSYLIESLEAQGVRHVFGIPGVHNLELYRGLAQSGIRHVTGRHEQGLGFMADGYARVAGRPGVCFTITGPGLGNIVTPLGQAYGDSIPVLVVSSENRVADIGHARGFLHEMPDQLGIAARVTGSSRRVGSARELPEALAAAFASLTGGRPRPAYIEIPRDALAADASGLAPPSALPPPAQPAATPEALAAIAGLLREAHHPVLIAGGGALRASSGLRRLAEHLDAPLIMTINARGVLPPGHPLGISMSPSLAAVRGLIAEADLVLAVGTELGPTDFDMYGERDFEQPRRLVRVDVDPGQLQKNARAVQALQADAATAVSSLLALDLGPQRAPKRPERVASVNAEALAALSPAYQRELRFLDLIRDTLPQAILVGDSTQPVYAGNLGYAAATPGSWFNSATGFGTLGYALPAATGAGLAAPGRPVVCLVGDGGLQFTLSELAVPRDVDAWLAIVVWNNRGYGEIKTSMLAVDIDPVGVDVRPPDFSHLARAYGYAHREVDSLESLERALRDFADRRQVVMLEVKAEAFE